MKDADVKTDAEKAAPDPGEVDRVRAESAAFVAEVEKIRAEVAKVIVGHEEVVEGVLIALFAGGHVLLEGVPGLGKTLLIRTLGRVLDLSFSRIQFTPDLMPADILGTNMVIESEGGRRHFEFQKGPIFAQLVLADEINRATPKTQSALLEAMQESRVTVSGTTYELGDPFLVMATQNPLEIEGTYPLPEAQLDRFFFKLLIRPSGREELAAILQRTTTEATAQPERVLGGETIRGRRALVRSVAVAPHVEDYAVRLTLATQPDSPFAPETVKSYARYGSSPRGAQALLLAAKVTALLDGRYHVSFDDVVAAALPALRHRIILNYEADADNVSTDDLVRRLLETLPKSEA